MRRVYKTLVDISFWDHNCLSSKMAVMMVVMHGYGDDTDGGIDGAGDCSSVVVVVIGAASDLMVLDVIVW